MRQLNHCRKELRCVRLKHNAWELRSLKITVILNYALSTLSARMQKPYSSADKVLHFTPDVLIKILTSLLLNTFCIEVHNVRLWLQLENIIITLQLVQYHILRWVHNICSSGRRISILALQHIATCVQII